MFARSITIVPMAVNKDIASAIASTGGGVQGARFLIVPPGGL